MSETSNRTDIAKRSERIERWKRTFIFLTATIPVIGIFWLPKYFPIWSFTITEIVELFTGFIVISLVIERALEVLMNAWRGKARGLLVVQYRKDAKVGGKNEDPELRAELDVFKEETRVLSLLLALLMGVVVSSLGFRVLQPLADPAIFSTSSHVQQRLFAAYDTFVTGAMIGGGSAGIHKIVDTLLTMVEKQRTKLKKALLLE